MIENKLALGLALAAVNLLSMPSIAQRLAAAPSLTKIRFMPNELVTSKGEVVRLPVLVSGRQPTIISFTYSGCRSVCPLSDIIMGQVEKLSASRGGVAPRLITITLDPANDTPQRLATRAGKIGAGPGRMWLTGGYVAVRSVLDGLKMEYGSLEAHPGFFLVVAPGGKDAVRIDGQPAPQKLLAVADLK